MKKITFTFLVFMFIEGDPVGQRLSAQSGGYDLPNNDADCPSNCRQIPWRAGSDVWNSGTLPTYTGVPCITGLTEGDGTTDNKTAIANCLAAISSGQAAVLPAGMYYINSQLTIPSNKALRGAGSGPSCAQGTWINATYHGDVGGGATCTTLKLGVSGGVSLAGSSSLGTALNLSGGYTKGSQTIVTSSTPTGVAVNDWILISELEDSEIPSSITGDLGACSWCGESNASSRPMTQIFQVTSVSGSSIGISRPLYYTFKPGLEPRIREITNTGTKSGIENIKLWGSSNSRKVSHINVDGCMLCWVKGVETYNTPEVSGVFHVRILYSYGLEVRDSYLHFGQGNSSGSDYAVGMFGPNSDHKTENVIFRENRHAWSQEGGGSGNVFLYNYVDDQWTDDASYLGSPRVNHGAHPYMTLFEGNVVSHFASDYYWGTSSHVVMFRNWFWGDATGNYANWTGTNWGFTAMEIDKNQHYYSAVGNVLGRPALHTTWSNALLLSTSCSWGSGKSAPTVYGFGCVSQGGTFDPAVRSTMILHGNYDYKTNGVAHWDGGSQHALKTSMYYSAKPAFFGGCSWPAFGPDVSSITNTLPAKARFEGAACSGSALPPPPTNPVPPTNLVTSVH